MCSPLSVVVFTLECDHKEEPCDCVFDGSILVSHYRFLCLHFVSDFTVLYQRQPHYLRWCADARDGHITYYLLRFIQPGALVRGGDEWGGGG